MIQALAPTWPLPLQRSKKERPEPMKNSTNSAVGMMCEANRVHKSQRDRYVKVSANSWVLPNVA